MKLVLATEKGIRIDITNFPFVVGRNRNCDYVLDGNMASRRHAQFILEGEKIFLEDMQSSNGTFVNMVQISSPVELKKGDLLKFADVRMQVKLVSSS